MRSRLIMEAIEAAVEKRRPPCFPRAARAAALALGAALWLAAGGCAARKAAAFEDFRSAARSIQVPEGGPFSEEKRYRLADDALVTEIREPRDMGAGVYRFDVTRLEQRTLEPAAAGAWRKIERLGVASWRTTYAPADLGTSVADGPDWSVDLRLGETSRHISGSSACPDSSNPARTVLASGGANSLDTLAAILDGLGR